MKIIFTGKLLLLFFTAILVGFFSITYQNWLINPSAFDVSLVDTILPEDWFHYIGYACTYKKNYHVIYYGNPNHYANCTKLPYLQFTGKRVNQVTGCIIGSIKFQQMVHKECIEDLALL